jgi:phage gp45-like
MRALSNKVQNLVRMCGTTTSPDYSSGAAVMMAKTSSDQKQGEEIGHFGLQAGCPENSHAFIIQTSGNANGVKFHGSHHPGYILKTQVGGETRLYDAYNQSIYMTQGGSITTSAVNTYSVVIGDGCSFTMDKDGNGTLHGTGTLTLDFPAVKINGQLDVHGDITWNNGAVDGNTHIHTGGTNDGLTGGPVGG